MGHRYFPSGHFPSGDTSHPTTLSIRHFPSTTLSICTTFHPYHFPSAPLSIGKTFHPSWYSYQTDGKWRGWKVVRMESGMDGKRCGWKVARMGRVVGWEMSFFYRMGNVPMGNSGDPKNYFSQAQFFADLLWVKKWAFCPLCTSVVIPKYVYICN